MVPLKGNTGQNRRLSHAADGTISFRSDEQAYENLMSTLDRRAALPDGQRRAEQPGHCVAKWRRSGGPGFAGSHGLTTRRLQTSRGRNSRGLGTGITSARLVWTPNLQHPVAFRRIVHHNDAKLAAAGGYPQDDVAPVAG